MLGVHQRLRYAYRAIVHAEDAKHELRIRILQKTNRGKMSRTSRHGKESPPHEATFNCCSRQRAGGTPSHIRKARTNEFASSYPSRYAASFNSRIGLIR